MPNLYPYLVSSLPVLQFGAKPPFAYEGFVAACLRLIPKQDAEIISSVAQIKPGEYVGAHAVLEKWREFDIALRNELVKVRSAHKRVDPSQYLRPTGYMDSSLAHTAAHIHRSSASILDAEKSVDLERWRFLEQLGFGHYFDLGFLIIYALKLLILERWDKVHGVDKAKTLEETLAKI